MTHTVLTSLSIFTIKKIWHGSFGRKFNKRNNIKCRFIPSCSNYAILALQKYGFFKGWHLTFIRILKCDSAIPGSIDYP